MLRQQTHTEGRMGEKQKMEMAKVIHLGVMNSKRFHLI